MKRTLILTAAAVLAAVPATLGLLGNTSFGESVPVRVPAGATVLESRPASAPEPGDDSLQSSSARSTVSSDDNSSAASSTAASPDHGDRNDS